MATLGAEAIRVLDTLPEAGLWCLGESIQYANAAAAAVLGEAEEALRGRLIWEFVHADDQSRIRARFRDRLNGKPVPVSYELDLVRKDGSRVRVEVVPRPAESPPELLIVLRDLPRQAQDESLVVALSEVSEQVQRARTIDSALAIASEGMQRRGITLHVARLRDQHLIPIHVPDNNPLVRTIEQGLGRPLVGARLPMASLPDVERVFRAHHGLYLDDLPGTVATFLRKMGGAPTALEAISALGGRGYSRAVLAPVIVEGRPWGLLFFASDHLTRADAAALDLFSAQMSSALEVVEAIERLQRSNRQVEAIYAVMEAGTEPGHDRLVAALLDIASVATQSHLAAMYWVEGADLVRIGSQATAGASATCLHERLPLDGGSVERPRALAGPDWAGWVHAPGAGPEPAHLELLPLRIQGRQAGLLVLGRPPSQPYSPEELRTSELLADQIAVQMEKARLLDDARVRVQELDLLLEVGRVVTESLDLDRVLEVAMVSLERMLGCDQAFVWLHDSRTGELRGAACADASHRERFLATRLTLQEPSGAVRAMLSGAPVLAGSAEGSPLLHQPLRREFGLRSVLVLPLLHRDEAIGAVSVADTQRERSWSNSEVERATVIARQLAVAVANARLFEDLRRSYDDLARTQAELVKRERLAALGELSAVVAHEVRNPLGVIFNSISSLRRPNLASTDVAMLLQMVSEEAERLNRIVGDLLDFARPHEPELRTEALEPLLRSVREAGLALWEVGGIIDVDVEPGLETWAMDARMLRQALMNLIVNGIQAMPRGGRLALRASRTARSKGAGVRIEVCDTGPGIAAGAVERIFEPFFTTKATGTGLGLAVVKRIVDAHRGEVSVESREGQGTTFSIWLPE